MKSSARLEFSIRRAFAVAETTLRDLGVGSAALALILALLFFFSSWRSSSAVVAEDSALLTFERRVENFEWVAAFATLVICVSAVSNDRRGSRHFLWLATPLRSHEYFAGKMLGSLLGAELLFLVCFAALVLSPGGALGQRALLEKSRPILPEPQVVLVADAEHRGEFLELRSGGAVMLCFDQIRPDTLQVLVASTGGSAALCEGDGSAPRVKVATGQSFEASAVVVDWTMLPRGTEARIPFLSQQAPLFVLVDAGTFASGSLLLRRDSIVLEAPPRGFLEVITRLLFGLTAVVILCACAGTLLALFLSEGIAIVLSSVLLFALSLRDLLLDVVETAVAASPVSWKWLAHIGRNALSAIPDFQEISGTSVVTSGFSPWSGQESRHLLSLLLVVLGCWVVGSVTERLSRRWLVG